MGDTMKNFQRGAGLLAGLAALAHAAVGAEPVYKCVEGGKTSFSSAPPAGAGNCQPMKLDAAQPGPAEAETARQRQGRAGAAQEEKAQAARIRDLIQNDPDALRRAQNMDMAKSLARQPVPVPSAGHGRRRGRRGGYAQ